MSGMEINIDLDIDDVKDLISLLGGTPLRYLDEKAMERLREQLQAALDEGGR